MQQSLWDHSTFSANRDCLLNEDICRLFFGRVLALAEWQELVSDEHFSVDGTLIQAWRLAGIGNSFRNGRRHLLCRTAPGPVQAYRCRLR